MAGPHLFRTYCPARGVPSGLLPVSRHRSGQLAHLLFMDTSTGRDTHVEHTSLQLIEQVLSLSELCEHLHVTAQTIYDLRSHGRGPNGFRVGRELRFRVSEIDAWLTRMESEDAQRHLVGGR
jgi:excisionase family DNA binding protein